MALISYVYNSCRSNLWIETYKSKRKHTGSFRSDKNAVKQVLLNAHLSFIDSSLTIVAYHSHTFHTFITWPLPVQREFDWEKVINRTHVKGLFS